MYSIVSIPKISSGIKIFLPIRMILIEINRPIITHRNTRQSCKCHLQALDKNVTAFQPSLRVQTQHSANIDVTPFLRQCPFPSDPSTLPGIALPLRVKSFQIVFWGKENEPQRRIALTQLFQFFDCGNVFFYVVIIGVFHVL